VISIASAFYGRLNSTVCPHKAAPEGSLCYSDVNNLLTQRCQGRSTCSINACNSEMGGDPCSGIYKYLEVDYKCVAPEDVNKLIDCSLPPALSVPGTNNCHANAQCANTAPGYTCSCRDGYSGDGLFCLDVVS
jgi:hypothetical protein